MADTFDFELFLLSGERARRQKGRGLNALRNLTDEQLEQRIKELEGNSVTKEIGRLQWHRVDKEALPDNCRYVWTNVGAGYHDDDGWWTDGGRLQGVIAWCEPKFEE